MNSSSLRKMILAVVWGAHAAFALMLFIQPHFTPKKKEHKTLIVKTITPKTPSTVKMQSVAKVSPAPKPKQKHTPLSQPVAAPTPVKSEQKKESSKPLASTQKKLAAPCAKKTEPAIADKKLSKEKKTPPPAKIPETRGKISDSLLKELEESIAKIEQKGDKKTNTGKSLKAPSPLTPLQIDTSYSEAEDSEEGSYIEMLVGHLRQTLQLPDYGEVKIQLSLRQDGSVIKIIVLRAQSSENKRYLEENLPYIRFPRFEGPLTSQKESSFTLTFVNEI